MYRIIVKKFGDYKCAPSPNGNIKDRTKEGNIYLHLVDTLTLNINENKKFMQFSDETVVFQALMIKAISVVVD